MGRRPKISIKRPDGTWITLVALSIELNLSYPLVYGRCLRYKKDKSWDKLVAPKNKRGVPIPKRPPRPAKKKKQTVMPVKKNREQEEDWSMESELQQRARKALAELRERR